MMDSQGALEAPRRLPEDERRKSSDEIRRHCDLRASNAGLALSLFIAAAAEIKSFNLEDDSVEISISGNIAPGRAEH